MFVAIAFVLLFVFVFLGLLSKEASAPTNAIRAREDMTPPEDRREAKSSIPQPFVWDRLSVRLWALFFFSLLAILASACLLPEDSAFPKARPLGFVSIPIFSSSALSIQ
jgi:hypothetical protein